MSGRSIPLILFFITGNLFAQENNYWNAQFGAKSSLLGGAAVSTYLDNGALFYNPATLCFLDTGDIAVSANLYQVENIKITNAVGDGLNLVNSNYAVSPQLISGNLKLSDKFEMGVILLNRNSVDFSFNASHQNTYSIYPQDTTLSKVPYTYIADYTSKNKVLEQWGGITLSYKINSRWGIGLTNFLGYRYQKYSQTITATAIAPADTIYYGYTEKFDFSRTVGFDNLNNIIKTGVAYNGKYVNCGLSVTLPSFNLIGIGSSDNYNYFSNVSSKKNGQSTLVFDKEKNLDVVYKTPFSCAFGFALKFRKTRLYFSAEYFAPLAKYNVMTLQHNPVHKKGVQFNADSVQGVQKMARELVNFGIGLEQVINRKTSLLFGFHSDFNAVGAKNQYLNSSDISVSYFDIWHATAGLSFMHKNKKFTIGLAGAYGALTSQAQIANFTAPTDDTALIGKPSNTSNYYYVSGSLVIGLVL